MEKFYIVTERSDIHNRYFAYMQNVKDVNEVMKKIMNNNGIETTNYSISNQYFVIYPTKNDMDKFTSMLKKESGIDSASEFKKSSKVYKEIFNELKMIDLKILRKPYVPFDTNIRIYGKTSSRLFDFDNVLYCSIDAKEQNEFDNPIDFNEIKGSEFYKVMESYK